jgi:hypothetical protein
MVEKKEICLQISRSAILLFVGKNPMTANDGWILPTM